MSEPTPDQSNTNNAEDTGIDTDNTASETRGRPPRGLYPHISRTHLAAVTGLHLSSIANVLQGKTRLGLENAVIIAREVGVSVEELSQTLVEQQEKWKNKHRQKQKQQKKQRQKQQQAGKRGRK